MEIRLQAVGETNDEGDVRVFFELNGQPRTVRVPNRKARRRAPKRPKAEAGNPAHVGRADARRDRERRGRGTVSRCRPAISC